VQLLLLLVFGGVGGWLVVMMMVVRPVHHEVGQLFTDTVTLKCTHTLAAKVCS